MAQVDVTTMNRRGRLASNQTVVNDGYKGTAAPTDTYMTRPLDQYKKEDPKYDPVVYDKSYGGSSGSSGGSTGGSSGGGSNYYSDLFDEFKRLSAKSRDEAIQAIIKNLDAVKGTYQGQISDVLDQYQNLVNQNEVKKERARRIIRENQANRGQLESGLGRQELLNMNLGYDNITSNLNSAKTKAVNDIYNLIHQAEAEAETNKSNIHNNYANALLQYRLANM